MFQMKTCLNMVRVVENVVECKEFFLGFKFLIAR